MNRPLPQTISVVVPCYNEEEVLPILIERTVNVLRKTGLSYELVFVDDGSKDGTWNILTSFSQKDGRIKAVKLSRNFGHQTALTCGLDQAGGDLVLIIDADLQDPPELLVDMLEKWKEGYDVVYGKRKTREGESLLKRGFAYFFYRFFRELTGFDLPSDTGDFRLLDKKALNALRSLRERHRFIRGMVSWVGYKQTPIYYERPQRAAGKSKYPFRKSLFLALDAIVSFSYAPLRLASYLGVAISGFAFLYIIIVLILKFVGISWAGYTSLMAATLLLGGAQLTVLGIMGEYVGRIFEQGQKRPLYLIDTINGEGISPEGSNKS